MIVLAGNIGRVLLFWPVHVYTIVEADSGRLVVKFKNPPDALSLPGSSRFWLHISFYDRQHRSRRIKQATMLTMPHWIVRKGID